MEVKNINVIVKSSKGVSFETPLTIANRYRYKMNIGARADKT